MTLALVLAALLAVACVVAVALPFLREPEPVSDALDELDAGERRRLEVVEARDRALAALKELEFDHRTGRSPTTTTARSSAHFAARLRARCRSSSVKALEGAVETADEEGRPAGERIS